MNNLIIIMAPPCFVEPPIIHVAVADVNAAYGAYAAAENKTFNNTNNSSNNTANYKSNNKKSKNTNFICVFAPGAQIAMFQ